MKGRIAFVCGGVEPRASGVGDYVLALAAELVGRGVDARIVALADPGVGESRSERVNWRGQSISVRRLPRTYAHGRRRTEIEAWLAEFRPEWISLQFVPYAFHSRGIVALARQPWAELGRQASMHVMFHETWVGANAGASPKLRVLGWLQRFSVRRMVRQLSPRMVHTSIPLYGHLLDTIGLTATILPLFGNIPVIGPAPLEPPALPAAGSEWRGGFFGAIHPGFPAERCFDRLVRRAAQTGRKLRIVGLGRLGAGASDFDSWSGRWPEITFERFESLTDDELSRALAALDFGLSTTPLNIIGKSGSAAALAEHGVPVLCPTLGSPVQGFQAGPRDAWPRAYLLEDYLENQLDLSPRRLPFGSRVREVAAQFESALDAAPRGKGTPS